MYKEKFCAVVKSIVTSGAYEGKLDAALAFLERSMSKLPDYVTTVFNMEVAMQTLRFRLEPEDYRAKVMELDHSRKIAHDCAIDALNCINRMCEKSSAELFFAGDSSDRYEVAEFCGKVVEEIFGERLSNKEIKETLDGLIESAKN